MRDVRVMSEGAPPGNVSKACVSPTRRFPLGGIVVKMRDQSHTKRIRGIQPFNHAQVAGNFSQAFPEPQTPVVHSEGMGVKIA